VTSAVADERVGQLQRHTGFEFVWCNHSEFGTVRTAVTQTSSRPRIFFGGEGAGSFVFENTCSVLGITLMVEVYTLSFRNAARGGPSHGLISVTCIKLVKIVRVRRQTRSYGVYYGHRDR